MRGVRAGLTDESGNLVEAYEYDPYGNHVLLTDGDGDGRVEFDASDDRSTTATSAQSNPYTFTGRRYDADTGLHYYRNRYYDDTLGRFISPDPLGYDDGPNTYNYVGNYPTSAVDPMGLFYWSADQSIKWGRINTNEEIIAATGYSMETIMRVVRGQIPDQHDGMLIDTWRRINDPMGRYFDLASQMSAKRSQGLSYSQLAANDALKGYTHLLDEDLQWVHKTLNAIGYVPVLGVAADLLNASIYYVEGNKLQAGVSLGMTVLDPAIGVAAKRIIAKGIVPAISRFKRVFTKTAAESVEQGAEYVAKRKLHRPYLRKSLREKVIENAKKTPDGRFIDPNTKMPIDGPYHFGHKTGREHRRLVKKAEEAGMTQSQFNDYVNSHPEWFQIEDPRSNMSHKYEKKGID